MSLTSGLAEQNRYTVPVVNKADALTRFLAPYISVAGVMIDHKYRVIYSNWGGMSPLVALYEHRSTRSFWPRVQLFHITYCNQGYEKQTATFLIHHDAILCPEYLT